MAGRLKLPGFLSNWLCGLELEGEEFFGLVNHQLKFALKEEADGRLEHCRVGLSCLHCKQPSATRAVADERSEAEPDDWQSGLSLPHGLGI